MTGVQLPNGGILKTLHLPETVTNLTIRNQTGITDFVIGGYDNISTLRLENVSEEFDLREILHSIPVGARVRVTGLERSFEDTADILAFYDLLDTMRGLDENGNNTDKAQISGIFTIDTLTGNDLAEMQERYPNIKIQYNHFTAQVNFYDDSGSTLLKTVTVYDGGDTAYGSSNPTKVSTAQYSYSFTGWSLTAGGSANANALKAVTVDRNVYAAYSKTVRKYTVYFYNGSTLLQTVSNVPYGSGAYYSGDTPEKTGVDFPEDYVFTGWSPSNTGITGNTYCYAQYKYIGYAYTTIVESSISGEYANDRVTAVGDYAFYKCSSLTGISLPSVESIGVCAFVSCTKLTSVSVPTIKTISRSAFSSCTALTSIDLHGVTSIAAMAFYCCTNLTTVILRNASQVCALGDINVFDSTALAQVFVPAAMVDAYKADSRWSRHASKILAIEDYPDITGG